MQPGCEHTRSASKRVLRRGRAEMRAPWIGPTMANGPLPLSWMHGTTKIRSTVTTQIGPALFPWRADSGREVPERLRQPGAELDEDLGLRPADRPFLAFAQAPAHAAGAPAGAEGVLELGQLGGGGSLPGVALGGGGSPDPARCQQGPAG